MVDTINPNITAGINPGGNALTQLGQYANIQNALNQNALFQQTYRARAALGPLAQASVGPDGKMDWDKYAIMVSSHPDTAWMAPDILNNIASRKLIDAQTINEQLKIQGERSQRLGNIFLAAGKDPKVNSLADFIGQGYYGDGMASGAFDPQKQKEQIAFFSDPRWANLKGEDARKFITQHGIALQQGSLGLTANSNKFVPDAGLDQDGNPVPGWVNEPRGTLTGAGGGAPVNPPQPGPVTTGAAAQAAGMPGVPTPAPAPTFTPGKAGPLLEAAYKHGVQLNNGASYAQSFNNQIKEGEQLLNKALSGKAAPTLLEIARWGRAAGLDEATIQKYTGGDLNATQALQKIMLFAGTQSMRLANEGNAAVRSVQEWQQFIRANPGIENDPAAIRQMWHFMKFQNRLVLGEQAAYNKWRSDGKNLTQFQQNWTQHAGSVMDDYLESIKNKDWNKPTSIGE